MIMMLKISSYLRIKKEISIKPRSACSMGSIFCIDEIQGLLKQVSPEHNRFFGFRSELGFQPHKINT